MNMNKKWQTVIKPTFQTQLLALSPKEAYQVQTKIALLMQDPLPDGKTKIQLKRKYNGEPVYRLRSGNFRIRYTLQKSYIITLLDILRRSEHNYDEDIDDDDFAPESLDDSGVELQDIPKVAQPDWEKILAPREP